MPASRRPSTPRMADLLAESIVERARFKKRGKNGKVGPPVQDALVERDFSAEAPNQLWISDITEHRTSEGDNATMESFFDLQQKTCSFSGAGTPESSSGSRFSPGSKHLRTLEARRGRLDPDRIRSHHGDPGRSAA